MGDGNANERRVAVITRTKNREMFLPRARASIEGQSFRDFVWVIVNDGGDPKSVNREAEAAREKSIAVVVIHNDESKGLWPTANQGISAVSSEFITLHDDDDTWHPEFLAKSIRALDNNDDWVGVITYCDRIAEGLKNDRLETLYQEPYYHRPAAIYLSDLFAQNLITPIEFVYRRKVYESLGGYDESFPVMGDWEFHIRVLIEGNVGVVPETLAYLHHRIQGGAHTAARNSIDAADNRHALLQARFRNDWLRKAIQSGQVHPGLLLSLNRQASYRIKNPITLGRKLRRLKSRLKNFFNGKIIGND